MVELDIPDYITIRGRQFSTELAELSLMRWMDLEVYEIEPLRYMKNLTSLDLNYTAISDLSPLAGLTNLTELRLIGNELVDVDGRGTPGVVASRWAFDGNRRYPFAFPSFISISPHFTQRLFFMYDNQLMRLTCGNGA